MLKRIISLLLTICLLAGVIPVLADDEYTVEVVLLPEAGAREEYLLRVEIARLIHAYKDLYSFYDYDGHSTAPKKNGFLQNEQLYYFRKINPNMTFVPVGFLAIPVAFPYAYWHTDKQVADSALYHPYYQLADQKQAFNVSPDSNAKDFFGKQIRSTEYTLLSEEEQKELYIWLIKETLKEKMAIDLTEMEKYHNTKDAKYYSFDVSKGKMVYDETLKTLDDKTAADMKHDWVDCAADAFEVFAKAAYEFKKFSKNTAKGIVSKAQEKATGEKKVDIGKAVADEALNQLIEFISNVAKDINEILRNTDDSTYTNEIKRQLAGDLASAMSNVNSNAVDYLRTTYLSNPSFLQKNNQSFIDAVASVIRTLDGEAFPNQAYEQMSKAITSYGNASEINSIMQSNGLTLDKIMTDDEILQAVLWKAGADLVDGLKEILKTLFKELIESLTSKLEKEEPGMMNSLKTHLLSFADKVIDELMDRIFAVITGVLEAQADNLAKWNPDSDNVLSKLLKEQFPDGYNGKRDSIGSFIREAVIDELIEFAVDAATLKGAKHEYHSTQKDPPGSWEKGEKIAAMIFIVIGCVCKAGVDGQKRVYSGNKQVIKELNDLEKDIDKALEIIVKFLKNDKNDTENFRNNLKNFFSLLKDLMEVSLASEVTTETVTIDWTAGFRNLTLDSVYQILSTFITKDEMADLLFGEILGFSSTEDVGKQEAKDIGLYKKKADFSEKNVKVAIDKITAKINESYHVVIKDVKDFLSEEMIEIIGNVWDSMMDCAESLATAMNSTAAQVTGTHLQSLDAERVLQAKIQSQLLEKDLTATLQGGRIEALKAARSFETYQQRYQDEYLRYIMNEEDVLAYYDDATQQVKEVPYSNWDNTYHAETGFSGIRNSEQYIVPLQDAIAVAKKILQQMNWDIVGMGAYLTLVENREEFIYTAFSEKYINEGVLMEEEATATRYNSIVTISENYAPKSPLFGD